MAPTDDHSGPGQSARCAGCGGPIARGGRYCLRCGARNVPVPPTVAALLERFRDGGRPTPPPERPPEGGEVGEVEAEVEEADSLERFMPSPRAAAVALMALLAFGVVLGSLGRQVAQGAGVTTVLLGRPASAPEVQQPPRTASAESEEASYVPPPAPAPAPEAPVPVPEAAPEAPAPPAQAPEPLPELPTEPTLPPISHVFLIVLADQGYEQSFGGESASPYLSKELAAKGKLLANYYAVAQGDLANEVALLSGQGPTPQTAVDCPEYADVVPATVGAAEQVEGSGCVYPATTETLPGQLAAAQLSWKAYVEDVGSGAPGQAATCRRPLLPSVDPDSAPGEADAYETWRNPFVYFHSLFDGPECEERDVGLEALAPDLKGTEVPALSYIVPDACHDGSETACAPGQPTGLAGAEAFLKTVVPEIEASDAYKTGGLIAITFAQAPQAGPHADSSSCCATPEYPNLPAPPSPGPEAAAGPVKPSGGGGRVGMLLISPFVQPGTVDEGGYFNHFSALRSFEELFGVAALGYAAEPAISPFDETVYDNLES